jgi:hypothetical protein
VLAVRASCFWLAVDLPSFITLLILYHQSTIGFFFLRIYVCFLLFDSTSSWMNLGDLYLQNLSGAWLLFSLVFLPSFLLVAFFEYTAGLECDLYALASARSILPIQYSIIFVLLCACKVVICVEVVLACFLLGDMVDHEILERCKLDYQPMDKFLWFFVVTVVSQSRRGGLDAGIHSCSWLYGAAALG